MANLSNINNILRTGSLGVGINRDPLGAFEISSATKPGVKMFNTSTNGKTYEAYSDTNGNYIIYDQDADDNRFVINTSGNATFTGNVSVIGSSKFIEVGSANTGTNFGFIGWNAASKYLFLGNSYNSAYNEDLVIDSSGNVGIGTALPQSNLDIKGSGNTAINSKGNLFVSSGGTAAQAAETGGQISFGSWLNGDLSQPYPLAAIRGVAESSTTNVNKGALIFGTMDSNTAVQERMRITGSGNVGIGTGADIYGDLHLEGGQQDIVLTNTAADGVAGLTISRIIGQARGYGNNGAAMQSIDFVTNSSTWYKGDIVFKTNNSDGTNPSVAALERMRIKADGSINIGSRRAALPSNFGYSGSYKVLILGSSGANYQTDAVTLSLGVDVTGNPSGAFNGSGREIIIRNEGSFISPNAANNGYNSILSWNSSGQPYFSQNVGINNTGPTSKLNVNGNDNGSAEYSVTLGSTTTAGGTANNASSTPVNKTLLTGYSIPYSGQTNSRLTTCGFLEFASTSGWTGSQRTWAITSGYDIGGQDSGAGGNKMAIILGNAQNVSPQIGTNGAIGESGDGDGANSLVACYWDNALNMRLANSGRLYTGGGGSAALPMITPGTDKNTGIWYPTSDTWALSTAGTERMRITSDGYLNAGGYTTASNTHHKIVTTRTNSETLRVENNSASPYGQIIRHGSAAPNTTDNWFLVCEDNAFSRLIIWSNGNVINRNNSYGGYSDIKLKENIVDATPKLDDLMKVKIRNYNLIGDDKKQIGVVAQELEEVFPGMIDESKIPDSEDETLYKGVKYSVFVPILIKAIQELKADNDSLKARIETLENN